MKSENTTQSQRWVTATKKSHGVKSNLPVSGQCGRRVTPATQGDVQATPQAAWYMSGHLQCSKGPGPPLPKTGCMAFQEPLGNRERIPCLLQHSLRQALLGTCMRKITSSRLQRLPEVRNTDQALRYMSTSLSTIF